MIPWNHGTFTSGVPNMTMRNGMIALIVPEIRNDYFASLVDYATEASKHSGYDISIYISNESFENEKRIFRKLLQRFSHLLLIGFGFGLDCHRNNRVGEGDAFQ